MCVFFKFPSLLEEFVKHLECSCTSEKRLPPLFFPTIHSRAFATEKYENNQIVGVSFNCLSKLRLFGEGWSEELGCGSKVSESIYIYILCCCFVVAVCQGFSCWLWALQ